MRFIFIIPAVLLASAAMAQEDPADSLIANFPAEAVTEVNQPTQPDVPAAPASGNQAQVPSSPTAPVQPVGPINELWPINTVPVFLQACTQGNVQLIQPCRCTIESVMRSMTHREFMEASQRNAIEKDIRYTSARQQCALKTQSQQRKN